MTVDAGSVARLDGRWCGTAVKDAFRWPMALANIAPPIVGDMASVGDGVDSEDDEQQDDAEDAADSGDGEDGGDVGDVGSLSVNRGGSTRPPLNPCR